MAVELLEKRIEELERIVYSEDKSVPATECVETLSSVCCKLQSAAATRDKVFSMFSKLEELEGYLEPECGDELLLADPVKLEIILSEKDRIHQSVEYLQKIEELRTVLDSEHIKGSQSFSPKLCELAIIQIKQKEKYEEFSTEVQLLLETYNKIIRTLSQQFILWDEIVTKVELAQQIKK